MVAAGGGDDVAVRGNLTGEAGDWAGYWVEVLIKGTLHVETDAMRERSECYGCHESGPHLRDLQTRRITSNIPRYTIILSIIFQGDEDN